MSSPITYRAPDSPPGPEIPAPRLIVERATRAGTTYPWNHAAPRWRRIRSATVEEQTPGSGKRPDVCVVKLSRADWRWDEEEAAGVSSPPVPYAESAGPPPRGIAPFFPRDGLDAPWSEDQLVRVVRETTAVVGGNWGRFGEDLIAAGLTPGITRRVREIIFQGHVVPTSWKIAGEQMFFRAEDFRYRMDRMYIYGVPWAWADPDTGAVTEDFLLEALPVFNAGGRPDRFVNVVGGIPSGTLRFGPPGLNVKVLDLDAVPTAEEAQWLLRYGVVPFDPTKPFCGFWTHGDLLDFVRMIFSDAEGFGTLAGLTSYNGPDLEEDAWLFWPSTDCCEATHPGLYRMADPEEEGTDIRRYQGKEIALGLMTMAGAISAILARASQAEEGLAGAWDWRLEPFEGPSLRIPDGAAVSRMVIYNTAVAAGCGLDLYLADLGESAARMPRREIVAGELTIENGARRNRIRGFGQRRVVQTTFSTVDGTLVRGWSKEDQDAYLLAEEEGDPSQVGFPTVFLQWVLPRNLPWTTAPFTGQFRGLHGEPDHSANVGIGAGEFLRGNARLFRDALVSENRLPGAEDTPLRRAILIWRSLDHGETWEPLPAEIGATLQGDVPAVRLAAAARTGEDPWIYGADYDEPDCELMITVALEADDRVTYGADLAALAGEYPLETVVGVTPHRKEQVSASRSIAPNLVNTPLVVDEGFTAAATKLDETRMLEVLCRRKLAQLQEYVVRGPLTLAGYHGRIKPGMRVRAIRTTLGERGARMPYFVYATVREVRYSFGAQPQTVLQLDSLPG
jgi:hypothetical protein